MIMRLDKYLSEGAFSSRTKAARAIERGLVLLNGKTAKPSDEVKSSDVVTVLESKENYVSEGGFKLAKAFSEFGSDVRGKVFADIGASMPWTWANVSSMRNSPPIRALR